MTTRRNPNLALLMRAVEQLSTLVEEMVFVGGCATGLLITDPGAPPIRPTKDVDVIVNVLSLVEQHRLSKRLRTLGFTEDRSEDAPICRWVGSDLLLDVMPTDASILGFGNRWYAQAMATASVFHLPSKQPIRLVTAPCFLITKLEAFSGRGRGDYQASHDMEDLIAVIDGRVEIVDDVQHAETALREDIRLQCQKLLDDPHFLDAIAGHLPPDVASQARVEVVLARIQAMAMV